MECDLITMVNGRLFAPEAIADDLREAYLLKNLCLLSAPLSGAIIAASLLLDITWAAMSILLLASVLSSFIVLFGYRVGWANIARLERESNESRIILHQSCSVISRDGLLEDIAEWARLNEVSIRCYIETPHPDPYYDSYRMFFSFEDLDNKTLFRLKWL